MIFELFAVIFAGVAGAGLMLLVTNLSRGRLPRWVVPLGAGASMMIAAIAMEYGWYARTRAALPEDMVVADRVAASNWYRPWTYAVPMTERFVAVDKGTLRTNAQEGLFLADLYFFGRWRPVQAVQVAVDCTTGRRADPAGGDGGDPVWRDVGPDDPIVSSVCAEA
ncbi:hypothetical protein ATO8_00975 [Roseivivax marinus]|uniref:Uncharacterized protein n=1 Tax=Roseivivax marinus TaxID=1379903 RepID=W4HPV3_9RHOB|nr:hypothetical protein [Roseivivax marinus]ETW14438.1 hypothetical protein ATO8_00975 [Roseivivax marinus]